MRWALAIGVIAVALAAAVDVHQRHTATVSRDVGTCIDSSGRVVSVGSWESCNLFGETWHPQVGPWHHPSWEDPAAVLLALGGVAVAVGIVAARRTTTP